MNCPTCKTSNENDSRFCLECGRPLENGPEASPARTKRTYLFILLLIPVLALAAGVGYYKYFLPQGIAAVVNGEEIRLSELDAEVLRTAASVQPSDSRLRYQVLNSLITERLVLQEAGKADMAVTKEEVAAALAAARTASGQSEAEFGQQAAVRYGSRKNFEEIFSRRLLVNKFISEKVIPTNADVRTSRLALERWLQDRSAAASVRITLAEQWSGAGCGCCANKAEAGTEARAAKAGCPMEKAGAAAAPAVSAEPANAEKASAAGLRYWHQKHGNDAVAAKVTDFGCHMQVDILKDAKIIGSLRYQSGAISEL